MGIITQLVLSSESSSWLIDHLIPVLSSILINLRLSWGNFPTRAHSQRDDLIHFCHGALQFPVSLRTLVSPFPSLCSQILSAIAHAERCVLERRVLRKTLCLCHGVYGNTLSLPRGQLLKFLKITCPRHFPWTHGDEDGFVWVIHH